MILVLEDDQERQEWFKRMFPDCLIERNPYVFYSLLQGHMNDLEQVFLDHDLEWFEQDMYSKIEITGMHVVNCMISNLEINRTIPIIVHSMNPDPAKIMADKLNAFGFKNCRRIPFVVLKSTTERQRKDDERKKEEGSRTSDYS